MIFSIKSLINDGFREAPAHTVTVESIESLLHELLALDSFTNDYGVTMPVGATVTIERIL